MQKYKIYQPLLLAFFSKDLYRDVAKNWRGMGFLYLLVLVLILSMLTAFTYYQGRLAFVNMIQPVIIQLPTITINKGKASIKEPVPYTIKASKTNKVIGVIDTSEHPISFQESPAWFMLTKDSFLFKENASTTRTQNLSAVPDQVYDQAKFQKLVMEFSYVITAGLFLLELLFRFCEGVLMILLLGLIAKLLTHTKLEYQVLCRLAAIAITPAVILAQILEFLHLHIHYGALIYFIISMVYLFYGVEANKEHVDSSASTQVPM